MNADVEVSVAELRGSPERVAEDLRRLADKVERGERFRSTASACVVSVGAPGQWAQSSATDADVAREFFRRFGPVKVVLAKWGGPFVEHDAGRWLSGTAADSALTEEHAAGEDGFVAALERALTLAREGGSR